ncbi:MAG TPA: phenylalanine--tRNA ligase subunit alpha [Terriglobia bacterium]|nr:phenylalanine--tRNA ligase subunit alpha [Terriglobia bacterium]HVB28186.1 phenylalanine--tRNA ligase subunit alpha [Terriglobia bacterium]
MSIDKKTSKTLKDLGIKTPEDIRALFAEVAAALDGERSALLARGAADEGERGRLAKELRDRWLARKGGLVSLIDEHWLKKAAKDLKPAVGRAFNELRQQAKSVETEGLLRDFALPGAAAKQGALEFSAATAVAPEAEVSSKSGADLTLPGHRRTLGSIHPVTQVLREIEDIFLGLGFAIESGPEIESVYYNFDALNIPESHPARDDWDTIYVNPETLLRTHTSPVQIRAMEKHGAPLYIICPGKAYRHDNPDSTHSTMFHQVEGLAVDTDITFADLKGTLDYFAKKFFGDKIKTNFSPSFFPFTEPSGELAISCVFCGGAGCRVCKESGWVEVMGCGMVHPEVLRHGGIDPERYSGWAFGLGVERFAMMKYDINDIQLFQQSDVRFLEQF